MTEQVKTKHIAIVKIEDQYSHYEDAYNKVALSITDWSTVTQEDYNILVTTLGSEYRIIERLPNESEFINNTVARHLEKARNEKVAREKRAEDARKKRIRNEENRKARQKESDLRQLKELQAKYGSIEDFLKKL